jgi:hypothetical protein
VVLLGEHFDISPQFFVDHIKNEPWYRIANVTKCIPPLPSSQKLHDFLHLRYVEIRTVSEFQPVFGSTHVEDIAKKITLTTESGNEMEIESDARSFMWPDKTTTTIPRKAGKLNPRNRNGEGFESLLCTRQAVAIWFNKMEISVEGWTGKRYTLQIMKGQQLTILRHNPRRSPIQASVRQFILPASRISQLQLVR